MSFFFISSNSFSASASALVNARFISSSWFMPSKPRSPVTTSRFFDGFFFSRFDSASPTSTASSASSFFRDALWLTLSVAAASHGFASSLGGCGCAEGVEGAGSSSDTSLTSSRRWLAAGFSSSSNTLGTTGAVKRGYT